MDKVFIERLSRSLTYECIYLHDYGTGSDACTGNCRWCDDDTFDRSHSTQGGRTLIKVHDGAGDIKLAA